MIIPKNIQFLILVIIFHIVAIGYAFFKASRNIKKEKEVEKNEQNN